MAVKLTINDSEIKNPAIRFIVTLALLLIFCVLCIIIFFLLLPVLWVLFASVILLSMVILASAKKLRTEYKVIVLEKKKLEHRKHRIS